MGSFQTFLQRNSENSIGKGSTFLGGVRILLALIACFVFVGATVALNRVQTQQWDLFADYAAIMPGQPVEALEAYNCQNPTILNNVPFTVTQCEITPSQEVFTVVTVLYGNEIVQDIVFDVGGAFQMGDLAQQWGRPDEIARQHQSFLLRWESGAAARVQLDTTFDYHLPVQFVWFSASSPND